MAQIRVHKNVFVHNALYNGVGYVCLQKKILVIRNSTANVVENDFKNNKKSANHISVRIYTKMLRLVLLIANKLFTLLTIVSLVNCM